MARYGPLWRDVGASGDLHFGWIADGAPEPLSPWEKGVHAGVARERLKIRSGANSAPATCAHSGAQRLIRTPYPASSPARRWAAATARVSSGSRPSAACNTESAAAVVPAGDVTLMRN